MKLAVYLRSVGAQKPPFGHTAQGDLTPLFGGFFDTATGAKREAASYARIAAALALLPQKILSRRTSR